MKTLFKKSTITIFLQHLFIFYAIDEDDGFIVRKTACQRTRLSRINLPPKLVLLAFKEKERINDEKELP